MAYDLGLEERIDQTTEQWEEPLLKKKMFGGLGYLVYGNMCFGVHGEELIIRATEEQGRLLMERHGIRVFDMTGRPMKGWFLAGHEATEEDEELADLLVIGRDFGLSLPPK